MIAILDRRTEDSSLFDPMQWNANAQYHQEVKPMERSIYCSFANDGFRDCISILTEESDLHSTLIDSTLINKDN